MDPSLQDKFESLERALVGPLRDGLIIAFSGGVDSAFLLWAAAQQRRRSGGRLLALTALSASMAQRERDDAAHFASALGVEHRVEESRELADPRYAANDGSRCYFCKSELFRICNAAAGRHGYGWLAYGYNESDKGDQRPGHRAALENNVLSPLADARLAKEEIRTLMRAHGLELAEKPSSPCLASRLMTGVMVTKGKLADVEALENILRSGGLRIFRTRLHEAGPARFVRIETTPEDMPLALQLRDLLQQEAQARGYRWAMLDLAGYRTGGGT
ncbi:MAG TPA: ATP-dependent sacrificial sulfur transferase LarE [Caldimonas sp.]|nr:ATP-dependent sacrificial sulfur transferase LarE [Caldimonas sp.]